MKDVITVTGDIGSGKSALAALLVKCLGYKSLTTGAMQREFAALKRLTSLELNELSMKDRRVDETIDSHLQQLNAGADKLVLDSRLAWHFVQGAFNVFVHVDPRIGAERVLSAGRPQESHRGVEDAMRNNIRRRDLENRRFEQLYAIQCDDLDNFHLVVDSTWVSPESVAEVVLDAFQKRRSGSIAGLAYLCPKSLYPTKGIRTLNPPEEEGPAKSMKPERLNSMPPIEVFRFSHYFFILDGHARVICALRQGTAHVPCRLHAAGGAYREQVIASLAQPWIHDWEAAHRFTYPSYPDATGSPR
jgi:cytidylate kinase